jgi:hypothetical protein
MIALTPTVVSKVMTSVDAHFTHSCFIKRQALTTTYNYRRDTGLVVDSQLLFYLADPSYVLVTNDGPLRKTIALSPQSARVIGFAEFCTQAGWAASLQVKHSGCTGAWRIRPDGSKL